MAKLRQAQEIALSPYQKDVPEYSYELDPECQKMQTGDIGDNEMQK